MMDGLTPMQLIVISLIGLAVFISVIALLSGIFIFQNTEETPVRDRLMQLKQKPGEGKPEKTGVSGLKETFLEFTGPIAQNLYGQNVTYQQSIKRVLTEAGLPDNEAAVRRFLSIRVATGLFVGGILCFCALVVGFPLQYWLIGLIAGTLFGATFVQVRLRSMAQRRKAEIRFTLSDTLDLMVVCMEAGLGLDSTISRVSEESERIAPELSYEFKRLTKELNAGIPRIDAFHNLGSRSGVDELKALCALIIQTDKLGTSIADTLRIYADDVRTKRRQRAELLASQASIKLTFPLVLLIFPPMFIVLLGPAVIQTMSVFFGKKLF